MTLPFNTKMSDEDVEYVIENFIEVVMGISWAPDYWKNE